MNFPVTASFLFLDTIAVLNAFSGTNGLSAIFNGIMLTPII